MIKRTVMLTLFVAVLSMLILTACHEERDFGTEVDEVISLSEQQVDICSEGRYYRVVAQMLYDGYEIGNVVVSSNDEWIELDADTLSRGGTILFYVAPNDGARSRDGSITLRNEGQKLLTTIIVHQRSEAEDDQNALNGDSLTRKARVGYGYNLLIDYMDPQSVTEPILDYERIVQAEQQWGTIIAEEGRSQQTLSYHSSYSLEEMSSWMQQQTTTEVKMLFCNKRVNKFRQISEAKNEQMTYGYSSLSKVVATRYLDEGKMQSILRTGQNIFTDEFLELYSAINTQPSEEKVRQLVNRFGTHLVTYADLGGRLDYSVNLRSTETSKESVERYLKYKNGKLKQDGETEEASHAICQSGDSLTFDIHGGTNEAVALLRANASTKDRYGQVDPGVLGAWMNSVRADNPKSVNMIRCLLQPIWQLFTNETSRIMIINHVQKLAYSEGGELGYRLQKLGLDNYYRLDVTADMQRFGTGANSTLTKLVCYDGLPKIEICNEYVPELRGDRRVNIFYPIYRQQTNIRRGFFLGDGENTPAEVTFDKSGGCYVRQLEGYVPGDRLATLYYVDGAFYPNSLGIDIPPYQMTVKDEWLSIPHDLDYIRYPIVKIGPGFWTRENLKDYMFFGEPVNLDDPDSDYYYYEEIFNGMLYAEVYYDTYVAEEMKGIFDHTTDPTTGRRLYWYVPQQGDIQALYRYVGKNSKALFVGQQSGFEAQFAGYYGRYDDFNDGKLFSDNRERLRYNGEYSFIVAKDGNASQALILAPNYTLKKSEVNLMRTNMYPVRAFRASTYEHSNQ